MSPRDEEPSSGPVRVLRVIARLNVGGPARHVALLNAGMDENQRFRSWLVTGTENPGEGTLLDYARSRGVEPLVIPEIRGQASFTPRDIVALAKLTALARRIRPHVVHTHTAKAGFLGRLAARAARTAPGGQRGQGGFIGPLAQGKVPQRCTRHPSVGRIPRSLRYPPVFPPEFRPG